MSANYASGLSPYEHKGRCGLPEVFDQPDIVQNKIEQLIKWVKESKCTVFHTGAGISTSAGISDFRGPKGVWTLEKQGKIPETNVAFDAAKPTLTHMALVQLEKKGFAKYVVSQNIDGLHMRSGFPCNRLSELHGNIFLEECNKCGQKYIREKCIPTMARNLTGGSCVQRKSRGHCRGKLIDTILDWEDSLPDEDLERAEEYSKKADLSICLGTSLQIVPSGNIPLLTKKNRGKLVIVNLQPTKHDKKSDLKISAYVDEVMKQLCDELGLAIPAPTSPSICLRSSHTDESENDTEIIVDQILLDNYSSDFIKDSPLPHSASEDFSSCSESKKIKLDTKDEERDASSNTDDHKNVDLIKVEEKLCNETTSNSPQVSAKSEDAKEETVSNGS